MGVVGVEEGVASVVEEVATEALANALDGVVAVAPRSLASDVCDLHNTGPRNILFYSVYVYNVLFSYRVLGHRPQNWRVAARP
jgi:hypothetical protein